MEPATGVDIELGLRPGAEDQPQFRVGDAGGDGARIGGVVAVDAEAVGVCAHPGHAAKPGRPAGCVFGVQAHAGFDDVVAARDGQGLPCPRALQAVENVVVLELQAQRVLRRQPQPCHLPRVAGVHACRAAAVGLRKLVTVDGIVEKIREVGKQREPPVDQVGIHLCARCFGAAAPSARHAVAMRLAAVGGVDGVEAAQRAGVHRALRNLVGGIPARLVSHA